jgi:hypothetical protein
MSGAIPALPQYDFIAWCLFKKKHRDNFAFTFGTESLIQLDEFTYEVAIKIAWPQLTPYLNLTYE